MRSEATQPATRAVVLLKPKERKKLDRLVASQNASSGEILRRCLRAYQPEEIEDEELLQSMFAEMNASLDKALESIRRARVEIRHNLEQIEQTRASIV